LPVLQSGDLSQRLTSPKGKGHNTSPLLRTKNYLYQVTKKTSKLIAATPSIQFCEFTATPKAFTSPQEKL
jgi:hypothetical protein